MKHNGNHSFFFGSLSPAAACWPACPSKHKHASAEMANATQGPDLTDNGRPGPSWYGRHAYGETGRQLAIAMGPRPRAGLAFIVIAFLMRARVL